MINHYTLLTKATYLVDIDGTLCSKPNNPPEGLSIQEVDNWYSREFSLCVPDTDAIDLINFLYDQGNEVHLHTSRYPQDKQVTIDWLYINGVKYHKLFMGKPIGHYYIDNDSLTIDELKRRMSLRILR